jgi:hypothetical protein
MQTELSEMDQLKQGIAIIFAAFDKALADTSPTFRSLLEIYLDEAYAKVQQEGCTAMNPKAMHDLELISWTREMVTGQSVSKGQGKPFFD